jgi:hypothetical protein
MADKNTVDFLKSAQRILKDVYSLAKKYASVTEQKAQDLQNVGQLQRGSRAGLETGAIGWVNQTEQAIRGIRAEAFKENGFIGFRIFHTKEYGVYLELANNRKYELLRPLINLMGKQFLDAVNKNGAGGK